MTKTNGNIELELPNGLTSDRYKALKDKWGSLVSIVEAEVDSKGGTTLVAVKSPENDRTVCGQFERFVDSNPDKAREILIQNCVLHGKEEVLENNYAFRSVSMLLIEMIPTGKARVKN